LEKKKKEKKKCRIKNHVPSMLGIRKGMTESTIHANKGIIGLLKQKVIYGDHYQSLHTRVPLESHPPQQLLVGWG
jgi:hypothetical protein